MLQAFLLIWAMLAAQVSSPPATAPAPAPEVTRAPPSPGLTAYVITMGPGDAAWEKFGHNMLWIRDKAGGEPDAAYNWGVFEFDEHFIANFIQGKLRYWMEPVDIDRAVSYYLSVDRTIYVQELNLSPAQVAKMRDFCEWNADESNKFYLYDYFIRNCSTQVRDVIDDATGGQVKARATTMPSSSTYRSETLRLTADDVPLYIGLDFILGQRIDRPLSAWEEMFIPLRMRERFDQIRIRDASGNEVPLVRAERLLHTSRRPPLRDAPPNRVGWFLLSGVFFGAVSAIVGTTRRRWLRYTLLPIPMLWALLSAFAGGFLSYAWTMTDHNWVRPNENIVQLSPLMLFVLLLLPFAVSGKRARILKTVLWLCGIVLALSVLGAAAKVLPIMHQHNANILALALPANAGMFTMAWLLARRRAVPQAAPEAVVGPDKASAQRDKGL